MKTGLNQSTSLRQELKINPRLYQAMDLLYMPLLDLQQHLKQELLNNPFLELVEPEDEDEEDGGYRDRGAADAAATEEKTSTNDEIDWEEILLDGFDAGGQREEHEEKEYYEPVTVDTRDLGDHLARPARAARPQPAPDAPRRGVHRQHQRGRLSRLSRSRTSAQAINEVVLEAAEAAGRDQDESRSTTRRKSRRCSQTVQDLDPAGRRRARPARVPHAAAARCGTRAVSAVPAGARLLRRADHAPLERDLEALRHQSRRRAGRADEIAKLDPKPGLRSTAMRATTTSFPTSSSTRSTATITSS